MPSLATTEARREAFETAYRPKLLRALIQQAEPALSAVEAGADGPTAAALVKPDKLRDVLNDLYETAGVAFAKAEYDELTDLYLKAGLGPEEVKRLPGAELLAGIAARLRRFFGSPSDSTTATGEGARRLNGMVETTQDIIKRTIKQAQNEGLSVPNTVKLLRERIAELSKARATLIARSELTLASNLGSQMGAEGTGLKLNKYWIATLGDGRTRHTHIEANGQTVPLKDTFSIGGHPARYPGDPLLPVEEIANCRCAQGYKPAA